VEFVQIERDIKSKDFKPIYLLMGEEAYHIDKLTDLIEANALTEDEKAFNQTITYGKDISIEEIIGSAKRYPMMAERQVVIVKEAQELKKLDAFEKYFEQPTPTTILVIAHKYKKVDKRSKIYKLADKNGVCFTSDKVKDYQ
jgi:DNA polymerase-3 subunit delta